jgi:hypothetical protein
MKEVLKDVSKDVYLHDKKEMNKDDFFEVIKILRPGCRFDLSLNGGNLNYHHFWHPENLPAPTLDEILAEIEYQKECKVYYQYAYDRCHEYPDGFEQFDMLWHAVENGIDLKESEWFVTIKAIKEKYPKPNSNPPIKKDK